MNVLEQCQIWNEEGEYQKIADAISAIPSNDRTPELDSELARAYNNLANGEDKELFQKAIELLKPHEQYFQGDHSWNFRIAFAYYWLDQEGPALRYFERALEALPGDEDTQTFIDDCRSRLSLPSFEKNFRQRTQEAWTAFSEKEAELRRLMDQDDREAVAEELIGRCEEILHLAFGSIAFELGFNGEKYDLILTPEGDKAKLFELVYFRRYAPVSILENWNIWVGRLPSGGFALRKGENTIDGSDVQVWVKQQENEQISLTLFCEKLLPLFPEHEGKAWWLLSTLTDQVLGEIPAMAHIDTFDVADKPGEEPSIPLDQLPQTLEAMGLDLSLTPEKYLDNSYACYELNSVEDPDADWRMDTYICTTRLPILLNEYLGCDSQTMDAFHQDGAVAGFLIYPLDGFTGEEWSADILNFRDALLKAVLEHAGEDAVTFLGGATGLYCGYLDFIAWDLEAVLRAAKDFFLESELPWASFHSFRRNVSTIGLLDREAEPASESGSR